MSAQGAIKRLLSLTVRDAMSTPVVHVSVHEKMDAAAAAMMKHSISGAPVIDEQGRCVGLLSAFDFVKRDARQRRDSEEFDVAAHQVVHHGSNQSLELTDVDDTLVSANMSAAVQAIAADTPLLQAAKEMCVTHIHHLPVLGEDGHPRGMVSSLDIVSALLTALDEQKAGST